MDNLLFKRISLFSSLIALSILSQSANATFANTDYGYGAINKSIAGSGSAYPVDSLASALNPAGIAYVNSQMDFGLEVFKPIRGYSANQVSTPFGVAPGSFNSEMRYFFIPNFGYVIPVANCNGAFGIAAYGNGGSNTNYPWLTGSTIGPGYSVYGGGTAGIDLKQFFINLSFAYKVHPQVSLGISLIPAIQVVSVTGFQPFQPFSWSPTNLSDRGNQYSVGLGTRLGVRYLPLNQLALAASYQPKLTMTKQTKYKGAFPNKGSLSIPSNGIVGLSITPLPNWTFNADYQHIWYSDEPSYSNKNVCSLTSFAPCIGVNGGSGFGWGNVSIVKLGAIWRVIDYFTLRAGFAYTTQPVLASQTLFNIAAPAVTQQHYTTGFTYKVNRRIAINTNFLYVPRVTIAGTNQFNTAQRIKIFMEQYELGASLTWKLDV